MTDTASTPPLYDILLGCALGDAWGRELERKSIEMITAEHGFEGAELPSGVLMITDDTQMSLYLADAVVGAQDAATVVERVIAAWRTWLHDPENYRGPGYTCLNSTRRLDKGDPWYVATADTFDGSGAVMRTWACATLPEHLWRGAALWQAASTHGGPAALVTSLVATHMTRHGYRPGAALGTIIRLCDNLPVDDAAMQWLIGLNGMTTVEEVSAYLSKGRDMLRSAAREALRLTIEYRDNPWSADPSEEFPGWRSHDALVCAAMCLDLFPDSPAEAVKRAVTTDGDSDTIGAVTGALAARVHPFPWVGIDPDWASRLEPQYREWIEVYADVPIQG